MSHIVAADLSTELLSEFAGLPASANQSQVVGAMAEAFATVLNDAEGVATVWTPTLQVNSVAVGGAYTQQQGRYWRFGDLIIAVCKVRIANVNASAQSLRIAGLPVAAGSDLAHWPTFMSVCSLISGDAHARLAAGESVLYINDDQREGITSWTFSGHTFFAAIGAVYKATS